MIPLKLEEFMTKDERYWLMLECRECGGICWKDRRRKYPDGYGLCENCGGKDSTTEPVGKKMLQCPYHGRV